MQGRELRDEQKKGPEKHERKPGEESVTQLQIRTKKKKIPQELEKEWRKGGGKWNVD